MLTHMLIRNVVRAIASVLVRCPGPIARCTLAIAFSLIIAAAADAQAVRFVRSNAPNNGDGLSWATAHDKLYLALDAAAANPRITQIWIAAGTYKPNRSGINNRDDAFALVPGVTLYGGFVGDETALEQRDPAANITTLSGDLNGNDGPPAAPGTPGAFAGMAENSRHVITAINFNSAPATLDGLTVRGGNADFDSDLLLGGGGLFIQSARVRVVNCRFMANSAGIDEPSIGGFGGALYSLDSEIVAEDSLFTFNRGDSGGAIGLRESDGSAIHAAFTNCDFVSNAALHQTGGAVWTGCNPFDTVERDLTFDDCLFENNQAQYGGAIIEQNIKHVRLNDCVFRGNESFVVGGAVWHSQTGGPDQEPILISRCTFIDNHTSDGGGALFFTATGQVIVHCTFIGNTADEGVGGAIRSGPQFGTQSGVGPLTLTNCLFAHNSAESIGAVLAFRNPTVNIDSCTFAGNTATLTTGGLFCETFTLTIDNTIFWNNRLGGLGGQVSQATQLQFTAGVGQTLINNSCVQGLTGSLGGTANIDGDPMFVDADGTDNVPGTQDDDLRVTSKSPVIDAGDAATLPLDVADVDDDGDVSETLPLDLDDSPRIAGRGLDIGAFESPESLNPADINGDGVVNVNDLLAVIVAWGPCAPVCPADVNGDGAVNVNDLLLVIADWG